ncbi:glycosyl transferase [Desulfitobacterium dichloroeliminans LMG P-21439]|uniref:Glycosyl transferase n=1 Tax=Desulfitobacterium dichloroeliminans (strain LMG P-21439 / DCA1) TaxID=871963 RepID=L0F722_DESDL|nr:glycosyltransferase family 2 protein [Desulfitobacterium dichloroeliminans]AGA68982.1 glycosyl transferase [Desulfitobacterium dichloroeliminans LMG P-21439]
MSNSFLSNQEFNNSIELSILMPCLNEAETIAVCIEKAHSFLKVNKIIGEVVIADNGSTDGSQRIAEANGARVIHVKERGYGSALIDGIKATYGKYIIMGDADDSYDFTALTPFVEKLREGYDLVMGNRFRGGIKPGAMPPLHRYLGNPVLSGIGRLFFPSAIGDFHCGLRGFNREAMIKLNLKTTGMEFASEMVVKSTLHKLRISEVPTTLSPDGRTRPPHLRSWRDGWRHLRFLLIFSPRWLFLYPGLLLLLVGLVCLLALIPGPQTLGGVTFDIHTMLYASMAIIVGFQCVAFAIFSKVFAINNKIFPSDKRLESALSKITLERGIVLGLLLFLMSLMGSINAVMAWGKTSFSSLVPSITMRIAIPSVTLIVVGIQVFFNSFFLTFLASQKDE